MIAIISLLIPPFLMQYLREMKIKKHEKFCDFMINYFFCVLFLNFIMLVVICYGFGSRDNVFYKLNQYNSFAVKYILLSSIIAVAEPYIETLLREKIKWNITFSATVRVKKIRWKLVVGIYAAVLFGLNFIRIFDNNFWLDEAFSINLVRNSVSGIISGTAADVHPPLYYFLLKSFYVIFGNQGWAFHFVSLIPCLIILILTMTVFWKQFGKEFSVIMITLACLSSNAVSYNVEVRMYSWGGLFLLLSFYMLYLILQKERMRDYVLFEVFSLSAAYVHYFCLLSVAFFYAGLLYLAVIRKQLCRKKVIFISVCTVLGYLPWMMILLKSIARVNTGFWIMSIPTVRESINYLFSNQFGTAVWGILFIGTIIFIMYEIFNLKIKKNEKGIFLVNLSLEKGKFSVISEWVIMGMVSIIGTIISGIIVSKVMRPIYVLRYIYPVSLIAWMILGVIVSRLKGKTLYSLFLVIYMCTISFPIYWSSYSNEKNMNNTLQKTLEATTNNIKKEDMILTNNDHIYWQVAECYFPGTETKKIAPDQFPELDRNLKYWLILDKSDNIETIYEKIEKQDFRCEQVVKEGSLGMWNVSIYQIEYEDNKYE